MADLITMLAASGGTQGEATDEYFQNTTLLLHGDGTNGAQNNTFLDSSTNAFTITRNGNTTQGSFSPFSKPDGSWGVFFDGAADELETASAIVSSTEYSVEAWIYPTSNVQGYIGAQYTAGNANRTIFLYRETDTKVYFFHPSLALDVGVVNLNEWSHVLITRDSGGRTRMFLNGVLKSTSTTSYTVENSSFSIGGNGEDGSEFVGYISNLRVVNGAIPTAYQTASTTLDTSIFTPSSSPLTAVSNTVLLTCQSNRFVDRSSSPLTLTVSGNPKVTPFSPFPVTTAYSTATNGGSGYFDGSGDYLSVPDNAALEGFTDFTIEFWINLLSVEDQDCILTKGWQASLYAPYLFLISGTSLLFYASSNNSSWDVANAASINALKFDDVFFKLSGIFAFIQSKSASVICLIICLFIICLTLSF